MADSNELRSDVQHGLDDNPHNDAEKGAALGGLGGAVVGAVAGSAVGPAGTVIGAVAGGLLGAGASGLAVGAVDEVDNDNTVSGIGDGTTSADVDPLVRNDVTPTYSANSAAANEDIRMSSDAPLTGTNVGGHNVVTGEAATTNAGNTGLAAGAVAGGLIGTVVGGPVGAVIGGTLGSVAGGVAGDATEAADDNDTLGTRSDTDTLSDDDFRAYQETNRSTSTSATAGEPYFVGDVTGSAMDERALTDSADPNEYGHRTFNAQPVENQPGYGGANDATLRPSPQTDYRAVDEGLPAIGATDTNADIAPMSDFDSAGVRSNEYTSETESQRSNADVSTYSTSATLAGDSVQNDAPGIHPENLTTTGAQRDNEFSTNRDLGGDNRDEIRSGGFNNDTTFGMDSASAAAASGDYEHGGHVASQSENPAKPQGDRS